MVNTALEELLVLLAQCETQSYLQRVLTLENQVLAGVVKRLFLPFLHRCDCLILRERAINRVWLFEINFVVTAKVLQMATSRLCIPILGIIRRFVIRKVKL